MKSFFSLFFLLSFFFTRLNGQGWERIYSTLNQGKDSEIKKILPVSDGFLMLVTNSVVNVGVSNLDFQIVKINENGSVVWSRNYDFGDEELAHDFISTSDGGYAVVYTVFQGPNQNASRAWWAKLDGQFDVDFVKEVLYPGLVVDVRAAKITEQNGGIWIFGDKAAADFGPESCFVRGYDLNGGDLEENVWGQAGAKFRDMEYPGGGDFVSVSDGFDQSNYRKIYLHRYNQTGSTLVWQKEFGEPQSSFYANDLCVAPDGGYLVAGARFSSGLLIKTDANGDLIWQKVYPPDISGNPDSLNIFLGIFCVAPTADGTGYWAVSGTNSYIPQLVLLRIDLQGNILWTKPFGPYFTYTFGRSLISTSDNGCLIGGSYHPSTTNGPTWAYSVKTNSAGQTYLSGVSGKLNRDFNGGCTADLDSVVNGEHIYALKNGVTVASAVAGLQGAYFMALDTGDFQITTQRPDPAWAICGQDTISITLGTNDTIPNVDFLWSYDPQPLDSVFGYIFRDLDGDCFRDSFETDGYAGWPVFLYLHSNNPDTVFTFSATTGANGYYVFNQLTGATNEMYANVIVGLPPLGSGLNCPFTGCPSEEVFIFFSGTSYQSNIGYYCDSLPPCPIIEVDIATQQIRPCSTSTYYVHYCNIGAQSAMDASVTVSVDPALTVTGSSIPWVSVNGNQYTFSLGDLSSGQCGDFTLAALAPCDDPAGTTYCTEAHAFPDTCHLAPSVNWDGSQIQVTANCTGDSVIFTIQNIGIGDMQNPLEYIVIEDNVLLMQGFFELDANEHIQIAYAANGAFFRMEADQSPGFPGLNTPIAWAEGCGGSNASLGFVNQYPLGDEEPWLDVFCLASVNSYDPNDKNGFPLGYADDRLIEQNTDIEYLIRFQNTGTASAYQVEIRDTLPVKWLDPASVRPGASSHDYVWDIQGNGVVVFKFPNIVLPDSNANFEASQGFVKFRISQRKDVALGTAIKNSAAIYFDNNPPVVTNQTLHTIGKNFVLTKTNTPISPDVHVNVMPNPARGQVQLQVEGLEKGSEQLLFTLFSALGKPVLSRPFTGSNIEFQVSQLPEGAYFYELRRERKLLAVGKMIKM